MREVPDKPPGRYWEDTYCPVCEKDTEHLRNFDWMLVCQECHEHEYEDPLRQFHTPAYKNRKRYEKLIRKLKKYYLVRKVSFHRGHIHFQKLVVLEEGGCEWVPTVMEPSLVDGITQYEYWGLQVLLPVGGRCKFYDYLNQIHIEYWEKNESGARVS